MSYYHVIYNSSEKNRRGLAGFGVRSATAGIPEEVLAAMQSAEVFNFDTSRPMLTPVALKENPEKIREVPATYFYTVVPVPGSDPVYVLGRKVAVGFDYVFYKDFKGGRLGNYVVDCYVFTTVPCETAFEMLYENAAAGSHHFIPRSPVPSQDNEEMAAISLGSQPDLEVEDRSFAAEQLPPIAPQALELMFAYIEARNQDRPLLVNGSTTGTAAVMGDFYRLLPPSLLGEVTFMTNYQSEGRKKGYAIVEKNELYPYQVFAKQFVQHDLKGGERVDTVESRGYREPLLHAIAAGDMATVHNKLKWLLSHAYAGVKGHSQATIDHLYNYYVDHRLDVEALTTDGVFLQELGKHIAAHPDDRRLVDDHVREVIAGVTNVDGLMAAIAHLHTIRQHINLDAVLAAGKPHLTAVALADADAFKQFYARCGGKLAAVADYVDLTQLPRHEQYLSSFHGSEWLALCDRFLPNHRQELPQFIARTFTDRLDEQTRDRAITTAQSDATAVLDACCQLLHGTAATSFEPQLVQYMTTHLLDRVANYNFHGRLPGKRDNALYTPLLEWQALKTMGTNVQSAVTMLCDLSTSQAMCNALADNGAHTLTRLAAVLEKLLVTGPENRGAVADMATNLIESFGGTPLRETVKSRFGAISNVAARATAPDDWDSEAHLQKAQSIAMEMKDADYLARLLPVSLQHDQNEGFIAGILDLKVVQPEELIKMAAGLVPAARDFYYKTILARAKKLNGAQAIEQLQSLGGLAQAEAEQFIKQHFPDAYQRYLKSLEPGIADKVGGFFKKMFAKKDK